MGFSLRVVRADDLLVLTFEFINLRLDTSAAGIPRLVREFPEQPEQEARIVVHFPPQHVGEAAFAENIGPPSSSESIDSHMAGPSRLAFRVPPATVIPLTMESLLDWRLLELVPTRRPDPPRQPAADETAIEMPYRLFVLPAPGGRWSHRRLPFAPAGRAELWHTSHTAVAADVQRDFGVTAVWSPDLQFGGPAFPMSLQPSDRIRYVQESANPVLFADVLRLSALGGWLQARGPSWNHDIAMGRDQKVRTEERGVLYPFGHEVTKVTTSERKFASSNTGVRAAYVMQKVVLYVREPLRTYNDRAMPFKEMRISQSVIPIDVPPLGNQPFVPKVGSREFEFPVTATDQVDHVHRFAARMVYVPENFADLGTVKEKYHGHETVDLSSQLVGFAPTAGLPDAPSEVPGPTVLRTMAMSFDRSDNSTVSRPLPIMTTASVGVPAAEQLFGAAAPAVTMVMNKAYVAGGFSGTADKVFADIKGGLPLGLPAERAGGVAAPKLEMTALSGTQGAFPDVKALVGGGMSQQEIVERFSGGKLLGVIDLATIVGFSAGADDLPQIKPITDGAGGVSFHWEPKIRDGLAGLLRKGQGGEPALVLDGTLSGASSRIEGSLSNVAMTFLGLLIVDFKTLTFRMQTGQSTTFSAQLNDFKFAGELEFVNKLQESVLKAFGDTGPSVNVTPQGVSAGFKLAIPTIPLGPIILQNLALSAALNLYFSDTPAGVTFGLSSRTDPFIVTYTVFGGGGYFAFTVDTKGDVSLEAALEFGGSAAIDLVIAKGVVQAMVGIRFELVDKKARLTGYVRIYGCVEVLEVVAISVEFYMGLTYEVATQEAVGEASVTVMVRVLAFSKSVTLHAKRRFSTKDRRQEIGEPVEDVLSIDEWRDYCRAFAA
jgi:hypothetical protein